MSAVETYTTPVTLQVEPGTYELSMPQTVDVSGETWTFEQWDNGSTNPIRTVTVTDTDLSVYATFAAPVIPMGELVITAALDGSPVVAPYEVVGVGTGTTPETLSLSPGTYTVNVSVAGATNPNQSQTVTVVDGGSVTAAFTFVSPVPMGDLTITATLDGSPVMIPYEVVGVGAGTTPETISLAPGNYQVTASLDGTQTPNQTKTVTIFDGASAIAAFEFVSFVTHNLNVSSSNLAGVPFTVNGVQQVTPYSENLVAGPYTLAIASNVETADGVYNFSEWEDGSTSPIRVISLTTDLALIAIYTLEIPPPDQGILKIYAYLNNESIIAAYEIPDITVGTTPDQLTLDPGTYAVTVTYGQFTETKTVEVVSDQTIRLDFEFIDEPTEVSIPYLPILIAAAVAIMSS